MFSDLLNEPDPPATPPNWIRDFGSAIGASGNSNGTAMGINPWMNSGGTAISGTFVAAPANRNIPAFYVDQTTGQTWIWDPAQQDWRKLIETGAQDPAYPAQQYDPVPGSLVGQWQFHTGDKGEQTPFIFHKRQDPPPPPKREEPKIAPVTRGKRVFRLD